MSHRPTAKVTGNACWVLLLIPAGYAALELCAGPLAWVLGTGCPELGFYVIRITPFLAPVLMISVWVGRRRLPRTLVAAFLVVMGILWLIDACALVFFVSWGMTFHHGDLLE